MDADVRITLRLPPALHDELKALTKESRRSLNSEIIIQLERALHVEKEASK